MHNTLASLSPLIVTVNLIVLFIAKYTGVKPESIGLKRHARPYKPTNRYNLLGLS